MAWFPVSNEAWRGLESEEEYATSPTQDPSFHNPVVMFRVSAVGLTCVQVLDHNL